jgi:DNA polymerase III epsilon subunit-like protein
MKNISIDLETLGTDYNAPIIEIGACAFEDDGTIVATFEVQIEPDFEKYHLVPTFNTIKWWTQQSEQARTRSFAATSKLENALTELSAFYYGCQKPIIWCHCAFDAPIIANHFKAANINNPIPYRNWNDLRTIQRLAGIKLPAREGVHHTALDDALYQAKVISMCLAKLNRGEL